MRLGAMLLSLTFVLSIANPGQADPLLGTAIGDDECFVPDLIPEHPPHDSRAICLYNFELIAAQPVGFEEDTGMPPLAYHGFVNLHLCNPINPTCVHPPAYSAGPASACGVFFVLTLIDGGCTVANQEPLYPVEDGGPLCLIESFVDVKVSASASNYIITDMPIIQVVPNTGDCD